MFKLISIDPGKCKCGLVLVDLHKKKVDQAIVLNTELLPNYVKNLNSSENISKVIIGNGTSKKPIIIGKGSIIGAGAVILKNLKKNSKIIALPPKKIPNSL